jgi:glycosyltransferase involved in cell wall biosynthesis
VRPASIGLLSTYPPTPCGLATFSAALTGELRRSSTEVGVVRVVESPESHPGPEVVGHLVNGSAASAGAAVRTLNRHDVVLVQHEYGIYGRHDGQDVLDVVDALTVPSIVVLHTVLRQPTPRQRKILARLVDRADIAVTMTETARQRLVASYGADPSRVVVIPHGAHDHGVGRRRHGRPTRYRGGDRPLVLTWGLLGPGKGVEWAIDAMPGLRDLDPRYLVAGRTHPKVHEREGEAYREGLARRVTARDVGDLVDLDDKYLSVAELSALVQRADVVLLPYDSSEQVTSGVLTEAVAAGRPVVSTAFPHAVELLSDGPGLVVPQRDPSALEAALRRVLSEPGLADRLAATAARTAPELLWSAVAARYARLADALAASTLVTAGITRAGVLTPAAVASAAAPLAVTPVA